MYFFFPQNQPSRLNDTEGLTWLQESMILPLTEGSMRPQHLMDVTDPEKSMRKIVVTVITATCEWLLDARYQAGYLTCLLSLIPQATFQYGYCYLNFTNEHTDAQEVKHLAQCFMAN